MLSIGSFFVIAWLSGFLANKLSETEQLLKEKQIDYQELDAFKDALLQGIGSGVAITDPDGRINYFNQQAQTLTMLDEANLKGKRLDQIFPGLSYDFQRNRSAGALVTDELALANSSTQGVAKQIRLTLAPLNNVKRANRSAFFRSSKTSPTKTNRRKSTARGRTAPGKGS